MFGFDLHYFIKAYVASAWCSKSLNTGGSNLTQINFGNIKGEFKFLDALKFYQKSLADLAFTLSDEEIMVIKKLTERLLNEHYYFSTIWPNLSFLKKERILDIISGGKGVIPYELIIDMESFFIKPENDFWEKAEFFSESKESVVTDDDYDNSKYLYLTLKMQNLGDLNDLYNAQDVILLSETIENRFQAMQDTHGFNPRRCNSASSMSGCIERDMSKIILALPTKYDHVKIFEQTVTGGFSSVNTRLAFDSQILLPNITNNVDLENDPMNKDFNCKVVYNLKIENEKAERKRVITKIFKLDEYNQYRNGMTEPLPTGCIKNNSDISW